VLRVTIETPMFYGAYAPKYMYVVGGLTACPCYRHTVTPWRLIFGSTLHGSVAARHTSSRPPPCRKEKGASSGGRGSALGSIRLGGEGCLEGKREAEGRASPCPDNAQGVHAVPSPSLEFEEKVLSVAYALAFSSRKSDVWRQECWRNQQVTRATSS